MKSVEFSSKRGGDLRLFPSTGHPGLVICAGSCRVDDVAILDDFESGWADEPGGFSGYSDG